MKFFLDTADLHEIEEAVSWGALAGVTTNPTLYSRIGGKVSDFHNHIKRICSLVDGPVSAESVSMDREGIIRDGRELAALAPNVVVKIPTMVEGLAATHVLAAEGIPVNMTLCFSVPQAILAARAGNQPDLAKTLLQARTPQLTRIPPQTVTVVVRVRIKRIAFIAVSAVSILELLVKLFLRRTVKT